MIAFFDVLVVALLAFPLLSGGFMIRQPHLVFEIAELGPLALVVAATAFFLKGAMHVPLEKGCAFRWAKRLWAKWSDWLEAAPGAALGTGTALTAVVLAARSLRRHWAYQSASFDLGIFTEAIWNLGHGHGYVSALKGGMNLLADHQSFVFPLLAPVFRFLPLPESLLVFQAAGLACCGAGAYLVAKPYLRTGRARAFLPAVPLLAWCYLPFRNAAAFDFHPEVLMAPTALFALAGLLARRTAARALGTFALAAAMAMKESGGPLGAGIALAFLAGAAPEENSRRFTRRFAWALLPASIALFAFDVAVLPRWLGHEYAYTANYSTQASALLRQAFGIQRLKFLLWTLGPLGFVPLLGWRALIASVPAYLMLFLSSGDLRVSILFHYGIECSVGLFWALSLGLARLLSGRSAKITGWLPLWLLFWALAGFGRSEIFHIREDGPTAHERWLTHELIPRVDPAASLSASGHLLPHLATRPWANHLPELAELAELAEPGAPGGKKTVDCVIYDRDLNNWPMAPQEWSDLENKSLPSAYRLVYRCEGLSVYQLAGAISPCLLSTPECPSS